MRAPLVALAVAVLAVPLWAASPAASASVTVVTRQARHGGTLSVSQVEVQAGNNVVKVPLADVSAVRFGDTDVVHTRQGKRVKGAVRVDGWVLKEKGADKPLARGDLRFLVPQAALGPVRKKQVMDAAAANGMTYHVRVPDKYDPAKGAPAVVVLHGSNANSADYLKGITQRWPKVAADYVLIGINGEWPNTKNPDAPPSYNYTYVNFVGRSKYNGFPGTDRESPALVAEVMSEIGRQLKLTKAFVTGHSQGGFLAYSCLMNYPDVFDGAMPISAGLIFQCEPTAYEDAELRKQQRSRPVAIVHGDKDPLVSYSMATAAHESFLGDGFPMLRLLAGKGAGHMFISLPFEEGIRWMESMASDDPKALAGFAQKAFASKEYRDALAYLDRARSLDAGKDDAAPARALRQKIEQLAAPKAKALEEKVKKYAGGTWVGEFDAFRRQFEFTEAAAGVMAEYNKLRAQHEPAAGKLWGEARQAFGAGNKDQGYKLCEEIVAKYYASTYYRYAKQTLGDRK